MPPEPKVRRLDKNLCTNFTLTGSMRHETMKPSLEVSPTEPMEVTAPSGATSSACGAKNATQEGTGRTVLICLDRAGRGETPSLSGTAAVNALVTDRPIDTRGPRLPRKI